jgi:hypothetical protein
MKRKILPKDLNGIADSDPTKMTFDKFVENNQLDLGKGDFWRRFKRIKNAVGGWCFMDDFEKAIEDFYALNVKWHEIVRLEREWKEKIAKRLVEEVLG